MNMAKTPSPTDFDSRLIEGRDYYSEGAVIVFTERYHLRRGYCCESGCRHCPYQEESKKKPGIVESKAE